MFQIRALRIKNKIPMIKFIILILSLVGLSFNAYANPYAVEDAIYRIEIQEGNQLHTGTGVLITPTMILTNCHVVRNNGNFQVMHRKTKRRFPTKYYYNLGNLDACVLVGNIFAGKPVVMRTDFKLGENVWDYGYPGTSQVMGQGTITGMVNTDKGAVIKSSLYCHPGSSGGPLLNAKGELIGLNFGTESNDMDHCLSIPMADIVLKFNK